MKLRKQIKNRVVAVAMLAVVLFGSLSFAKPKTAYAATYSYTKTESWRGVNADTWTMTLNPGRSWCPWRRGPHRGSGR